MRFEIRTKTPAQYFSGTIKNGYCPLEDKKMWYVDCDSLVGGGRKISIGKVTDFRNTNKAKLIKRIKNFAKQQKYLFSKIPY